MIAAHNSNKKFKWPEHCQYANKLYPPFHVSDNNNNNNNTTIIFRGPNRIYWADWVVSTVSRQSRVSFTFTQKKYVCREMKLRVRKLWVSQVAYERCPFMKTSIVHVNVDRLGIFIQKLCIMGCLQTFSQVVYRAILYKYELFRFCLLFIQLHAKSYV